MPITMLLAMYVAAGAYNADTVGKVYADGRDGWTLFDQKLMNRQLFDQLDSEEQDFRFGRHLGRFAGAADGGVGAQIATPDSELGRYHGFFTLDTYWALRLLDGVEVNLNLDVFNPSASDGYRLSSQINAGVALHIHQDLFSVAGDPVELSFLGIDLDTVTLGQGLLIENTPLEGHAGGLRYGGIELREVFAGRTFWFDDDLQTVTLCFFDTLELMGAVWLVEDLPSGVASTFEIEEELEVPRLKAYYTSISGDWVLADQLRFAGEYAARIRPPVLKNAVLARVDFLVDDLVPSWRRVELHAGYQFRYYQRGFGPRDTLVTSTALPNLPMRENAYVTNSFEYLALSRYYDQWSHTAMLEVRISLADFLDLYGAGEWWVRTLRDPRSGKKRVVYVERFGRAPNTHFEFYYRGGFQLRPWIDLPYRFSILFTNKIVASGFEAVYPDPRRFSHDPLIVLEAEVLL